MKAQSEMPLWQYLDENSEVPWVLGPELWANVFTLMAEQLNHQRTLYSWMETGDAEQWLEEQAMIAESTQSKQNA
jgi:hypothetical protein